MRFTLLLFFSVLMCTQVAFAQESSEFTIRVFGGSDTESPTTPTLTSADPVSPTQVDLVWTTATDNFAVGGYVVTRGSSTIATTTLTTFSDVGLTPSTTYSYSVQAFDVSGNYSSSSNILSAFTPNFPEEPETPSQGEGTVARVVAKSVTVSPGVSTTSIEIESSFPARFEIKWGRTASYELGYIASEVLQRDYLTMITDLEPGTIYEYEIIGYTPFGKSNVVDRGQFRTLDLVDLSAPANVANLFAYADASDAVLSWNLPTDDDLALIRIVRNHLSFPTSITDGSVVYQGLGNQMIDQDILSRYSPVYYTAFAIDTSGNVSSGAVAIVYANQSSSDGFNNILNEDGELVPIGDGSVNELVEVDYMMPMPSEIYVVQDEVISSFADATVRLSAKDEFMIQIPAGTITTNIKTILVSLKDPTDHRKNYSFLLRLNKDRTAYEAVLAPVSVLGRSLMSVTIYDYEAQLVGKYVTGIEFHEGDKFISTTDLKNVDFQLLLQFLLFILLLLLLLLLWMFSRREDEDKRDDSRLPKRYSTDS